MFITPWEVARYSTLSKEFPVAMISNVLEQTEMDFMDRYFGYDFRVILEGDLKLDSNTYQEWVSNYSYAANSKVIYNGLRYVSNVTTIAVPGYINNSDWVVYEIFTQSEYNDLWKRFLRKALSFEIAAPAVIFATFQAKGNGLMRFNGQDSMTATQADIGIFTKALESQRDRLEKLMTKWIIKAHETYDDPRDSLFKEIEFIETDECFTGTFKRISRSRMTMRT